MNVQPTAKESLVEKWILHKLNLAAAEVNRQLTERNFMLATSAAYNFWLYELCDVYIVRCFETGLFIPVLPYSLHSGSNETHDRRNRFRNNKEVCAEYLVYLS
jgi:hypothetical protein